MVSITPFLGWVFPQAQAFNMPVEALAVPSGTEIATYFSSSFPAAGGASRNAEALATPAMAEVGPVGMNQLQKTTPGIQSAEVGTMSFAETALSNATLYGENPSHFDYSPLVFQLIPGG